MTLDTIRHDKPTLIALAAALLLFASPFVAGDGGMAAISAHALGIIAMGVGLKSLMRPEAVDRWLFAGTGALTGLLPWIAGFAAGTVITWVHLLAAAAFLGRTFWPGATAVEATPAAPKPHDDGAMPSS